MTKLNCLFAIAVLGLAPGGCKDGQKSTGGTAGGEILPGSTSDAMLPLDSVRSQPPLAVQSSAAGDRVIDPAAPGKAGSEPTDSAVPDVPAATEAPAEPAPAEPDV
jgi:hypothetical protein